MPHRIMNRVQNCSSDLYFWDCALMSNDSLKLDEQVWFASR